MVDALFYVRHSA